MQSIPIEFVQYEIARSGMEDCTALYQIVWALNSKYPRVTISEKIEICKQAISNFLERGIINLFLKSWISSSEKTLNKTSALSVINETGNWMSPSYGSSDHFYCFTSVGDLAQQEANRLYTILNGS